MRRERTRVLAASLGTGLSRLVFEGLHAPALGAYAVLHGPDGVVGIEPLRCESDLEVWSHRLDVPIVALPPPLEMLARFARGDLVDVALTPVVLAGPPFFVRVWAALRRVPRGRVVTYGELAREVGAPRAMRAVGRAMAGNPRPLVVPCHRVVAEGGGLGGYSGGIARKRALLALEGVEVEGGIARPNQLGLALDLECEP